MKAPFRGMINRLSAWWRQPPARQRILNAMSETEWRPGLDVLTRADTSVLSYYQNVANLESEGLVESKWDDGPIPATRHGHRRRLYRLKAGAAGAAGGRGQAGQKPDGCPARERERARQK